MELVLYYIRESSSLLVSFLILTFVLGIIIFLCIRNFRQDSRLKVGVYGLFLGLRNVDILAISLVIIRVFLAFYSTMITNQDMIFVSLIMIAIISIIYALLLPKKMVSEIVCSFMQIVMIYFIYIINGYMTEIETNYAMLMIKICLIVFTLLISAYFWLRNMNDIVEHRWDKQFEKKRKQMEKAKVD